MNELYPGCVRHLTFICLLLLPAVAFAYDPDVFSAAVDIQHRTLDMEIGAGRQATEINSTGMILQQPLNSWLSLGLHGGYASVLQPRRTLLSGEQLYGNYLGAYIDSEIRGESGLGAGLQVSYTYWDVDASQAGQRVELRWYETRAEAGPLFRFARWRFSAGGYYRHIDGNEFDTGTIKVTHSLNGSGNVGAYFGVDYFVDRGGSIGLFFEGGSERTVRLRFRRDF